METLADLQTSLAGASTSSSYQTVLLNFLQSPSRCSAVEREGEWHALLLHQLEESPEEEEKSEQLYIQVLNTLQGICSEHVTLDVFLAENLPGYFFSVVQSCSFLVRKAAIMFLKVLLTQCPDEYLSHIPNEPISFVLNSCLRESEAEVVDNSSNQRNEDQSVLDIAHSIVLHLSYTSVIGRTLLGSLNGLSVISTLYAQSVSTKDRCQWRSALLYQCSDSNSRIRMMTTDKHVLDIILEPLKSFPMKFSNRHDTKEKDISKHRRDEGFKELQKSISEQQLCSTIRTLYHFQYNQIFLMERGCLTFLVRFLISMVHRWSRELSKPSEARTEPSRKRRLSSVEAEEAFQLNKSLYSSHQRDLSPSSSGYCSTSPTSLSPSSSPPPLSPSPPHSSNSLQSPQSNPTFRINSLDHAVFKWLTMLASSPQTRGLLCQQSASSSHQPLQSSLLHLLLLLLTNSQYNFTHISFTFRQIATIVRRLVSEHSTFEPVALKSNLLQSCIILCSSDSLSSTSSVSVMSLGHRESQLKQLKEILKVFAASLTSDYVRSVIQSALGTRRRLSSTNAQQELRLEDEDQWNRRILSLLSLTKYFPGKPETRHFCRLLKAHKLALSCLTTRNPITRQLAQNSLYMVFTRLFLHPQNDDIHLVKELFLSPTNHTEDSFATQYFPASLLDRILHQSNQHSPSKYNTVCYYDRMFARQQNTDISTLRITHQSLTNEPEKLYTDFIVAKEIIFENSEYLKAVISGPMCVQSDDDDANICNLSLTDDPLVLECLVHLLHNCGVACPVLRLRLGASVSLCIRLIEVMSTVMGSNSVAQQLHTLLIDLYFGVAGVSTKTVGYLLGAALRKYDRQFVRICLAHLLTAPKVPVGVYSYAMIKVILSDSFHWDVSLLGVEYMDALLGLVLDKQLEMGDVTSSV